MTRRSRTLWIWMLIVQISVLAPWAVAAGMGSRQGEAAPCAGVSYEVSLAPGCPDGACSSTDCLGVCTAAAIPVNTLFVLGYVTGEWAAPATSPPPSALAQPPLHPPPIL